MVIDESFVDFADETETLIEQNILSANKNLCVVKSLSKSHGIGGLRLGVLASGDTDFVAELKRDAVIWNINSFAEFYMQIAEKYKRDYLTALKKFRAERKRFVDELKKLPNLRVVPTQANFVMVELANVAASEVTKKLLVKRNILVKDLSAKIPDGNYLRLAIRSAADNDELLAALKQILSREE